MSDEKPLVDDLFDRYLSANPAADKASWQIGFADALGFISVLERKYGDNPAEMADRILSNVLAPLTDNPVPGMVDRLVCLKGQGE